MKFAASAALSLWLISLPASNAAALNNDLVAMRKRGCAGDSLLELLDDFPRLAGPLCSLVSELSSSAELASQLTSACDCMESSGATPAVSSAVSPVATSAVVVASAATPSAASLETSSSVASTGLPVITGSAFAASASVEATSLAQVDVKSTCKKSKSKTKTKATKIKTSKPKSTKASSTSAALVLSTGASAVLPVSVNATSAAPNVAPPTITTGNAPAVSIAASCTVTAFSALAAATSACTAIQIQDVTVPASTTLDLSKLQDGTTVVFAGTTTFEYAEEDYDMIRLGGTNIEVYGTQGAVIDGNGQAWWDGEGSNGGKDKPDHFFVVSKALGSSSIHDLTIQNWPTHCFEITGSVGLNVYSLTLNNTAGDAPNSASGSKAAAHNSDGFDLSSTNDTTLHDINVYNQDDCVAVTSGSNITVANFYCSGGHGLSIGSIGGKSNNNVADITFRDSSIVNSQNGARIKSNYGTTGSISNIVYENIHLSSISDYGIDIQQDYENGGPTGNPSNGVTITGVTMTNITGTATSDAQNYYILCGSGSCTDFAFNDISITGGTDDSCNVTPTGDFSCN